MQQLIQGHRNGDCLGGYFELSLSDSRDLVLFIILYFKDAIVDCKVEIDKILASHPF